MKVIKIPNTLTEKQFDKLLENILPSKILSDRTISFDFSETSFISSFGMVLFILLCEDLHNKRNVHLNLSKPNSKNKINSCMYILARLGFFINLPSPIKVYPFKPKSKSNFGTNDSILEVTKLHNIEEAIKIVDLVETAIKKTTKYSDEQIKDICLMVSEIAQNIFYHSESNNPAIISIQRYPHLNCIQLVIADSGIGIPVTIQRAVEYKNKNLKDYQTIIESIKQGVSQFGKIEDRGEGLRRCVELSDKHKATMYIRSNHGCLMLNFLRKEKHYNDSHNLSGTQIYVNFPTNI